MTIETKFKLGQRVRIVAHGVDGIVNGFWVPKYGPLHVDVESYSEGKVNSRYFAEAELEAIA